MQSQTELQRHLQLVLTDRSTLSKGQNYAVFSKNAWRLKPLMPMRAVYRNDAPPGPAGRWLIDYLNGSSRARKKG
jgi:hypothetical protein